MSSPLPQQPNPARLRRALLAAGDEDLLARAHGRGWLTEEQYDRVLSEIGCDTDHSPAEHAVAQGWLSADQVRTLEAEWARSGFARHKPAAPAVPDEVRPHLEDRSRHIDEFVLVEPLGTGGAGEVWKAWDLALVRWVAIKRPHAAGDRDGAANERMQHEALAATRLLHPNVVPVYRVGSSAGRPYIAMAFIRGRTLLEAKLPLRQAVEAARTVAQALEHAHGRGLVHRDLKPGNLMIDESGRVWLLDFGLAHARDLAAGSATRPGVPIGTAAFMSPEQAAGDARSRHPTTDVYGLGATLYHLVTGAAPFSGDSFAAIAARVQTLAPPPPRSLCAEITRDLDTVILTAMAKDPRDRYASAAALAEDLGRVLADQPIRARRAGLAERLWRVVRRSPRTAAAASVLVVVLAAGAAFGLGRLQAERAASSRTLREVARISLRAALALRRRGDHVAMRDLLPALEATHTRASARAAGTEGAEGAYLMGRMHRALMDEERALAFQQSALALCPSYLPARYERLVLLSRAYQRRLHRAIGMVLPGDGPGVSAPGLGRIATETRRAAEAADPELASLRRQIETDARALAAGALSDRSTVLDPAQKLAARGLLAYTDGSLEEARRHLGAAIAKDPDLEEAWEAAALVTETVGPASEAEAVYSAALGRDRGYVPLLVGRCRVRVSAGKDTAAAADATEALAASPELVAAHVCRGRARMHLGHTAMLEGGDPTGPWDAAEGDFEQALLGDGGQWGAAWGRATVNRYRAHYLLREGRDPGAALAAAEADLARALVAAPGNPSLWAARGRTRTLSATARLIVHGDAGPDFAAAETDLRRAIAHHGHVSEWEWLGDLLARRGRARLDRGLDARPDFAAAETAFAGAFPPSGSFPWAHYHRGLMRLWQGQGEARAGRDPLTAWRSAEDDLGRAIAGDRHNSDFFLARAALLSARARRLGPAVGRVDARAAAADLARASVLNPRRKAGDELALVSPALGW